jgi:hypothetical protein
VPTISTAVVRSFVETLPLKLQDTSGYQIVQSSGNVVQSIGDALGIGPAVGGIHSMALDRIAQAYQGVVFVVKQLHQHDFKGTRRRTSCE